VLIKCIRQHKQIGLPNREDPEMELADYSSNSDAIGPIARPVRLLWCDWYSAYLDADSRKITPGVYPWKGVWWTALERAYFTFHRNAVKPDICNEYAEFLEVCAGYTIALPIRGDRPCTSSQSFQH